MREGNARMNKVGELFRQMMMKMLPFIKVLFGLPCLV